MADISGRFLQLKAITPMLPGQTWETRIAADAAGAPNVSIKGGNYSPLAYGVTADTDAFQAKYAARSRALVGLTDESWKRVFYSGFSDSNEFQSAPLTGGSITSSTTGGFRMSAVAAINSGGSVSHHNNGVTTIIASQLLKRWYSCVKFRLPTLAPAAGTAIYLAMTAGAVCVGLGVLGSVSTTKFGLSCGALVSSRPQLNIASAQSILVGPVYTAEQWYDGIEVRAGFNCGLAGGDPTNGVKLADASALVDSNIAFHEFTNFKVSGAQLDAVDALRMLTYAEE